jgi:RNA polymerase sigma-70 factor (ECF subfamily)
LSKDNSNTTLVKLLRQGDIVAFDAIYHKYSHKLQRFVLRYVKQGEDAEGIVQEVFIKIWESRKKIDMYQSFEGFIFTIAYNSTISLLRKRMSETKSREYIKSLQQPETAETVIDELQYKEIQTRLQTLLSDLTPRQREIYKLSREEGLSHKEIADKLNLSESTVNNHLVNVLKYLKSHLDKGMIISTLYYFLFLS